MAEIQATQKTIDTIREIVKSLVRMQNEIYEIASNSKNIGRGSLPRTFIEMTNNSEMIYAGEKFPVNDLKEVLDRIDEGLGTASGALVNLSETLDHLRLDMEYASNPTEY